MFGVHHGPASALLFILYIFTEKGISFALKGQYKVRMSKMYTKSKSKMHKYLSIMKAKYWLCNEVSTLPALGRLTNQMCINPVRIIAVVKLKLSNIRLQRDFPQSVLEVWSRLVTFS